MTVNTNYSSSSSQGGLNHLVSDDWAIHKEGFFYTIENREGYIYITFSIYKTTNMHKSL